VSAISTRPCSLIVSMRAGMTFYIDISHFLCWQQGYSMTYQ
jgi:hypothetical protein